jgi:hypothetical protein
MKMETAIQIVIGIVQATVLIFSFYFARHSDACKRSFDDGAMRSDTEYVKRQEKDILLELKDIKKDLGDHAERITRCEESSKFADRRIDAIENKPHSNRK